MKKIILLFALIFLILGLSSCTENMRTKQFGGTSELVIQENYKVVNVTWKDNDLWILVKPMTPDDVAESYKFYEKSSWGIWEGTYNITEIKK